MARIVCIGLSEMQFALATKKLQKHVQITCNADHETLLTTTHEVHEGRGAEQGRKLLGRVARPRYLDQTSQIANM